jgi:hypothetical protein
VSRAATGGVGRSRSCTDQNKHRFSTLANWRSPEPTAGTELERRQPVATARVCWHSRKVPRIAAARWYAFWLPLLVTANAHGTIMFDDLRLHWQADCNDGNHQISDIEKSPSRDPRRNSRHSLTDARHSSSETGLLVANLRKCRHFRECPKSPARDPGGWLPFLNAYRTMCLAPDANFRHMLEEIRDPVAVKTGGWTRSAGRHDEQRS